MPVGFPASCCCKATWTRPLENLYDPGSGQTWLQAMTVLRQDFNNICASTGVTTAEL